MSLKPIKPQYVTPINELRRVRWLGPDGGWRSGYVALEYLSLLIAIDDHRNEQVLLFYGEHELDVPKDDEGKPRTTPQDAGSES